MDVEAELKRARIEYTFGQIPGATLGSGVCVVMIAAFAASEQATTPNLLAWIVLQLVIHAYAIGLYLAFSRGRISVGDGRALWLRRLGVVLTGAGWAVAGALWPMHAEELGFAVALCLAGLMAGATQTLAGDPPAYVAFGVTAITPDVLITGKSMDPIAALLAAFFVVTCYILLQNARVLRTSLSLRWENAELLARAIADREAAEAARAEAERAGLAKTRFLAAASHDLRQPVQALALFADVLARKPEPPPDERARAIAALGRASEALRAMLEGLFDLSRLDAGVEVGSARNVALAPLLEDAISGLHEESARADVPIVLGGRSLRVFADPALLSRVVHNLGSNAVRHGRRGRVLVAMRRRGDRGVVEVWDQGPGIPNAHRERIFEEFVQLKNSERDRARGLGLGLPMVRRICEVQGWRLSFRTAVGKGSVFRVELPLAGEEAPAPTRGATARGATPCSVLLVEDDVLLREAATRFFEADGFRVEATSNAMDALRALERLGASGWRPDVLVTDHRLPGALSGADLVRRLRASGAALPAVVISGDIDGPFAGESPPEQVRILRKPVSGETLLGVVAELLASRG